MTYPRDRLKKNNHIFTILRVQKDMTSKQLFPSSPEQVTLTSPGVWLTTKKRGRDDKAIDRDAAAAVSARRHRRNRSIGSKGSVRSKDSAPEQGSHGSIIEMSELTHSMHNKVLDTTQKSLKSSSSSESEDEDFIKRKRRRPKEPDRSNNSTPSYKSKTSININANEEIIRRVIKKDATEESVKYRPPEEKSRVEDINNRLQLQVLSLQKKLKMKNKLLIQYRAKLREIIHSATDILMLTGEE